MIRTDSLKVVGEQHKTSKAVYYDDAVIAVMLSLDVGPSESLDGFCTGVVHNGMYVCRGAMQAGWRCRIGWYSFAAKSFHRQRNDTSRLPPKGPK